MTSSATSPDPELQALPEPRRPWRRATLLALALTLLSSALLAVALLPEVSYALVSGQPTEISHLSEFEPEARHANTWVRGRGVLGTPPSGYRRPLDPDRFRLAPVEGNPALWIELRQPEGSLGEHFVPPSSFVGRLLPLSDAGLRYSGLSAALSASGQEPPPAGAWLLVDGETPDSNRWAFGVLALLLGFCAFSGWGMVRLLAPARS